MSNQIKVFISSLKMAVATFCSRILGLVREQVLAYTFGASGLTDAFLVAYRIPNLLRDLFAEGAFSSAFVPTFVEANNISEKEGRKLLWSLFILLGMTTLVIGGIIFIFTPEIINLFAPTFKEDPTKLESTILLTRIMSPFLCFVSIAALFMGALNSLKIFFIPSLAPAFFNIVMIISMLILPGFFYSRGLNPILSLGVGVFIGGLVQAFVQFPLLIKRGFGPIKPDKVLSQRTKQVMGKLGPGLIGFAATQINLLINTILASSTIIGAVSWLSYSFRLFQLPVGILSVSIGNSNLVHFSTAWKAGDKKKANSFVSSSYFLSLLTVLPAMIALFIFNEEIINLIFERGKFSRESTIMTAKALRWYALGLPFYSMNKIFVPTFYAIDKQKIPVMCSIFTIAVNIIFCVYFTPIYGFEVLALGTTLSMFINSLLQGSILKKELNFTFKTYLGSRVLKILLSFIITLFLAKILKSKLSLLDMHLFEKALTLGLSLGAIAICYFSLCVIFGERDAVMGIIRRFKRKA